MCSDFYGLTREFSAAFKPPPLKHITSRGGSHSFHKTVFTAALAFLGLISLFRHGYYLSINHYPLSTIHYKLILMISRSNRFHGYNSLRNVYRHGKTARGPLFAVKALPNPKRQTYRLAVVVSRKVNKSAVARNRLRRRLYETARLMQDQFNGPHDIVITVFHDSLVEAAPKNLKSQLKKQLKEAGVIK